MENSQPLSSTESFSLSWLVTKPNYFPENPREKEPNFNFNLPIMDSPTPLVHADEIFSHGQIMPLYINTSKLQSLRKSSTFSVPQSPIPREKMRFFPQKWRTSKRLLQKCLTFMNPFVGFSRKSIRVDDLERRVCEVESLGNSVQASPIRAYNGKADYFDYGLMRKARSWNCTPQVASPLMSPRNSNLSCCDVDQSSIHEAILHCKRSIEK